MSKQRPILFSNPMVQAILQGRKTQTRRIFKVAGMPITSPREELVELTDNELRDHGTINYLSTGGLSGPYKCPYGKPGDILWVRETWGEGFLTGYYYYKADGVAPVKKWRPSIHMPREACRLFLKITNIRVERLQDISEEDARAEGVPEYYLPASHTSDGSYYSYGFNCLWNEINGKESWKQNPWVWAITFERTEKQ